MQQRGQSEPAGSFQGYFLLDNRETAGKLLARRLKTLRLSKPFVLAIPRGGIVIGCEIAEVLECGLDIVTPVKLHAPDEAELAIGAVMNDGSTFLNEYVIDARMVPGSYVKSEKELQMREAGRRMRSYRDARPYPKLKGMDIILVDDGIATGATMMAAVGWARAQDAASITIAVPVIPNDMLQDIGAAAENLVYLAAPEYFAAIGQFYREFGQVGDSEAGGMLDRYWNRGDGKRAADLD